MACMFTGLVETVGIIDALRPEGPGVRLLVRAEEIAVRERERAVSELEAARRRLERLQ